MLDRLDHAVLLYIFNSYPEKITIQYNTNTQFHQVHVSPKCGSATSFCRCYHNVTVIQSLTFFSCWLSNSN